MQSSFYIRPLGGSTTQCVILLAGSAVSFGGGV